MRRKEPTPMRPSLRAGLAVFAIGLALAGAAAVRTQQAVLADVREKVEARAERLESSLARRINRLQNALSAARAAHTSLRPFDDASFGKYVEALSAGEGLPGMRALGMVERVPRSRTEEYTAFTRRVLPDFQLQDAAGTYEDLFVVRMIEPPVRGNRTAIGLDLAGESRRRETVERAIATGDTAITPPVEFRRDAGKGWLVLVPFYRPGLPLDTPAERREAAAGLFYARVGINDVMRSISGLDHDDLQYRVFDGLPGEGHLLHDSRGGDGAPIPPSAPSAAQSFQAGGRSLSLQVWSTRHDGGLLGAPGAVFLQGALLALLAALLAARLAQRHAQGREERRQAAVRQRRAEELLHTTELVAVGLDESLRVRWLNPGFCLATGIGEEAGIGRSAARLLRAAAGHPTLAEAARRLAAGAASVPLQLACGHGDEVTAWLDATLQPDAPDGYLLRAIDITARRLAEQRLAQSEHVLRLVLDNVPARVSYWGTDSRLRLANRTFQQAWPLTRIGATLEEVHGPAIAATYVPRLEKVFAGEAQRFERDQVRPDGSRQVVLIHLAPDVDDVGHVTGAFALALDISELKQAQEAAQRASEAKTQFLSHMSHEIRTPMNAILGMLTLLRGTALDGRQADYARKAESAARSLLGLLNDILDLSKIEAGRLVLDPAPFRPDVLLHDLSSIMAGAAQGKGLDLRFELDPALPRVLVGDDLRLRQVLVNLGGNAVKFTPQGHVAVRMRAAGRDGGVVRVAVEVEDTGIGIAKEDQQRVFTDFSQASGSTARHFGGTGLGLGICRRLVAMMGGELLLDSEPGRGSRFHFHLALPVAPDTAAVPLPRQTAPAPLDGGPPLAGLHLLVVEDNLVNQQVARELLTGEGARVTLASDGAEGVRCMQAAGGSYDAVLMDMQMPVMDGCTAAREIRGRLGDRRTPIIAMTANAMAADRERCLAAGMDDHVAKPFEIGELVAVLLRHCRPGQAQDGAPAQASLPLLPVLHLGDTPPPAPRPEAFWDRGAALERTGGSVQLLEQVLPVFRRTLETMGRQMEDLAAGRPPAGGPQALFHTIKGMAGTLAADELSRRAALAEKGVVDGLDGSSFAADVQEAIAGTLAALDAPA